MKCMGKVLGKLKGERTILAKLRAGRSYLYKRLILLRKYKLNTKTFTRPKRRSLNFMGGTNSNESSYNMEQMQMQMQLPNVPLNHMQQNNNEPMYRSDNSGGINLQIGGYVTNMQKSFLSDTSPPPSMDISLINNSLITSADFSNVSFLQSTHENMLDNEKNVLANELGYSFNDLMRDRKTLDSLTLSADDTLIKDSNIAQIDDISLALSKTTSSCSTMDNSTNSVESTNLYFVENMNNRTFDGQSSNMTTLTLTTTESMENQSNSELNSTTVAAKEKLKPFSLEETILMNSEMIADTTFNLESISMIGDERRDSWNLTKTTGSLDVESPISGGDEAEQVGAGKVNINGVLTSTFLSNSHNKENETMVLAKNQTFGSNDTFKMPLLNETQNLLQNATFEMQNFETPEQMKRCETPENKSINFCISTPQTQNIYTKQQQFTSSLHKKDEVNISPIIGNNRQMNETYDYMYHKNVNILNNNNQSINNKNNTNITTSTTTTATTTNHHNIINKHNHNNQNHNNNNIEMEVNKKLENYLETPPQQNRIDLERSLKNTGNLDAMKYNTFSRKSYKHLKQPNDATVSAAAAAAAAGENDDDENEDEFNQLNLEANEMFDLQDLANVEAKLLAAHDDGIQFDYMLEELSKVHMTDDHNKVKKSIESIKKRLNCVANNTSDPSLTGHEEATSNSSASFGHSDKSNATQQQSHLIKSLNETHSSGKETSNSQSLSRSADRLLSRRSRLYDNINISTIQQEQNNQKIISTPDIMNTTFNSDINNTSTILTNSTTINHDYNNINHINNVTQSFVVNDDETGSKMLMMKMINESISLDDETGKLNALNNTHDIILDNNAAPDDNHTFEKLKDPQQQLQLQQQQQQHRFVPNYNNHNNSNSSNHNNSNNGSSNNNNMIMKRERDRDRFKTIKIVRDHDLNKTGSNSQPYHQPYNVPCIDDSPDDIIQQPPSPANHSNSNPIYNQVIDKSYILESKSDEREPDFYTDSHPETTSASTDLEYDANKVNTNYLTFKYPKDKQNKRQLGLKSIPTVETTATIESSLSNRPPSTLAAPSAQSRASGLPAPRSTSRPRYLSGLQKFSAVSKATSAGDLDISSSNASSNESLNIRKSKINGAAASAFNKTGNGSIGFGFAGAGAGAGVGAGPSNKASSTATLKSPMGIKSKSFHNLSNQVSSTGIGLSSNNPSRNMQSKLQRPANKLNATIHHTEPIQNPKSDDSAFKVPNAKSFLRPSTAAASAGSSGLKRPGLPRPASGYYSLNNVPGKGGLTKTEYVDNTNTTEKFSGETPRGSTNSVASQQHKSSCESLEMKTTTTAGNKATPAAPSSGIPKPSGLRPPTMVKRSGLPRPLSSIIKH